MGTKRGSYATGSPVVGGGGGRSSSSSSSVFNGGGGRKPERMLLDEFVDEDVVDRSARGETGLEPKLKLGGGGISRSLSDVSIC